MLLWQSSAYDTLAREAFVELVSRYICPGSELLDFGCGTGIDGLQYARKGYRVQAYDNSPGMLAQLQLRCKAEVASGQITAWSEDYPSFLDRFPQSPAPSAAVANFAVLISSRTKRRCSRLRPESRAARMDDTQHLEILFTGSKLKKSGWWLRSRDQHGGSPVYTVQPYATYMHFVPHLLRAAPQFHLVGRANCGRFVRYKPTTLGNEQSWWGPADSKGSGSGESCAGHQPHRLLGHFVFLVLRRDA